MFKNDHKFTETTIITSPPSLHYTHLTPPLLHYTYLTPPPATHNLPSTSKKKKKKWRDYSINPPLTQSTSNAATHGPHHREQNPNPRWQTHVVAANQADQNGSSGLPWCGGYGSYVPTSSFASTPAWASSSSRSLSSPCWMCSTSEAESSCTTGFMSRSGQWVSAAWLTHWSKVVSLAPPVKCLSVTCKQLLLARPLQDNFELFVAMCFGSGERERERESVGIVQ